MAVTAPTAGSKAADAAAERRAGELEALGQAFRRVFRMVNRLRGRDTHLGGSELSHAQFQLLIELDERGEAAVGELAAAAQLAAGTVTRMLDGLVAAGHVQRVRSGDDRRVVLARLTASGRDQIVAKRAAWRERWEDALAGVGSAQLAAATDVLERLAAMFDAASGPSVGEACPERVDGSTNPADPGVASGRSRGRKPV